MLSSRAQHIGTEGPYFPTKTPSRLKGRSENAIHAGSRTVGPKGKNVAPRTPFGPASVQPNRLLKNVLVTQGKAPATNKQNRPFLDKTPFPNRLENYDAPEGGLAKIPKLVFLETDAQKGATTPELQRPSSTRKHSRSRRSGSQRFETPMNSGRHWDVGDISIGSPEVQIQETIPEDDFDEVEYMAPNTLDIPYQPPVDFDLPDYKLVGETFLKQVFSAPVDDSEPPELVLPVLNGEAELSNSLALREIEDDDPFRLPQEPTLGTTKPTVASKVAPRSRPLSALPSSTSLRSTSLAKARPATAASTVNPKPPSRAAITVQPISRRPTNVAATRMATAPSKSSLKPPVATRPPTGKTAPIVKGGAASKVSSTPSTSRSTPNPRNILPNKIKAQQTKESEPVLFQEVSLEFGDDFVFEV